MKPRDEVFGTVQILKQASLINTQMFRNEEEGSLGTKDPY